MINFKTLAGINTKENKIIIFEVTLNDKNIFTMSASVGVLENMSNITLEEVIDFYDEAVNWDNLKEAVGADSNDKKEIIKTLISNNPEENMYKLIRDCSCTDYEFLIKDNIYNFETESTGQCFNSYKNYFTTITEYHDWLYTVWKEYHLKELPTPLQSVIKYLYYTEFKEEDIREQIKEYLPDFNLLKE